MCLTPKHLWTGWPALQPDATFFGESGLILTSLILHLLSTEDRLYLVVENGFLLPANILLEVFTCANGISHKKDFAI
ncbi:hypothetical protein CUJ84_pRLN2000331 (plasmid) [Rhizobium leguminosarum]|uniref:Uncharacterized protein n=1 Tax=Rhizobium leguminosarum TaxID=384 RepID=A0A2K9ZF51_RHILE|nr:hypothetical protein CUJ84_pRLN2000331 [Rhizobium leguminosarum]